MTGWVRFLLQKGTDGRTGLGAVEAGMGMYFFFCDWGCGGCEGSVWRILRGGGGLGGWMDGAGLDDCEGRLWLLLLSEWLSTGWIAVVLGLDVDEVG